MLDRRGLASRSCSASLWPLVVLGTEPFGRALQDRVEKRHPVP